MPQKEDTWVVYLRTVRNNVDAIKGVCEQAEWNAMESAKPGLHHLLLAGIATEAEAEMLARGDPNAGIASAILRKRNSVTTRRTRGPSPKA